jgi:hypothetical protein
MTPWDINWSQVKTVLIDSLNDKDMDTETIIKLIEVFARLEVKSITEYSEGYVEVNGNGAGL